MFKRPPVNRTIEAGHDATGYLRKDPGKVYAVGPDTETVTLRGPFNPSACFPAVKAAVFIDFENMGGCFRPHRGVPAPAPLLEWLDPRAAYARTALCRVYAHQKSHSCNAYRSTGGILAGAEVVNVTPPAPGKNSVDLRIAVDVMEVAYTRPDISLFVLVSSDADFIPVADKLRSLGKVVVGVGAETAQPALKKAFSRWNVPEDPATWAARRRDAAQQDGADRDLLVRAVRSLGEAPGVSEVRLQMAELDHTFGKDRYQAKSFTGFLKRHADLVRLVGAGNDAQVKPVEGAGQVAA
ncbi:NYN domain-containing protein [Streptomyces sp. 5-10]|uniref:NYN domain-containing protein n=1 Tax=Streptomyces sp. 5-10 TaxID=878925 RepID=UPI00168B949B|nr:NYN domain-containing protein [Streptomyces sp. 5-10]MBD3004831.1 NYN domain-containing protein [Streptomyces sp. 5-10]